MTNSEDSSPEGDSGLFLDRLAFGVFGAAACPVDRRSGEPHHYLGRHQLPSLRTSWRTLSNILGTVALYFSWICITGFGAGLVMIGLWFA